MESLLTFWEKFKGLVTSQRFIVTVATLIVSGLVMFNLVVPLFKPDFTPGDVPDADAVAVQIGGFIASAVAAISFFIEFAVLILGLIKSFTVRPPTLTRKWDAPEAFIGPKSF